MTHRRLAVALAGLSVVALVAVTGVVFAQSNAESADCPGKIACPLTGEQVCRDQCPTVDPNRPDCPGRIVCPLTGKLVCKDRCPLGVRQADSGKAVADFLPPCCAKKMKQ